MQVTLSIDYDGAFRLEKPLFCGELCYLIAPYTQDPERLIVPTVSAVKTLLKLGLSPFAPTLYGHSVVKSLGEWVIDTRFWSEVNNAVMSSTDIFAILDVPELQTSEGCQEELKEITENELAKTIIVISKEQVVIGGRNLLPTGGK